MAMGDTTYGNKDGENPSSVSQHHYFIQTVYMTWALRVNMFNLTFLDTPMCNEFTCKLLQWLHGQSKS